VYIGKEFTKDEMIDARTDELLDGPESWMNMLTLQEQFEMLTQAGYDVELTRCRCVSETRWLMEYADIVDPSSIDLTLGGGLGEDGWDYGGGDATVDSRPAMMARRAFSASVARHAPRLQNPLSPSSDGLRAGLKLYRDGYSRCHGEYLKP
jgi:hypothetical protein